MNDSKKLSDASLLEKESFYSHPNMEDITDAEYTQAKRFPNICILKAMHYC